MSISTFILSLIISICLISAIIVLWESLFNNKDIEEKINNLQIRTASSGAKITQLSIEVTQLKNQIIILKEKIK